MYHLMATRAINPGRDRRPKEFEMFHVGAATADLRSHKYPADRAKTAVNRASKSFGEIAKILSHLSPPNREIGRRTERISFRI